MIGPPPRFRLYHATLGTFAKAFLESLDGSMGRGNEVEELEGRMAEQFGVPHAVAVAQARVGIYLLLRESLQPGQAVILSPYTIADVINMVVCAGCRPVFADLAPGTCNICPESLRHLLQTEANVGAVLVTHLHGLACDMNAIETLCQEFEVVLFEDAAQAFGTLHQGRIVGSIGRAGVLSFGQYKNVNAFYGGMVLTHDAGLAERLRQAQQSWPMMSPNVWRARLLQCFIKYVATSPIVFGAVTFPIFRLGRLRDIGLINRLAAVELDLRLSENLPEAYKARFSPLQARLVLEQLGRWKVDMEIRQEHSTLYHELLQDAPGLTLPPHRTDGSHGYNYYPVIVSEREKVVTEMMRLGRDVAVQHLKNCADLPAFRDFYRDCPIARQTSSSVVLLPNYPRYGRQQVRETANALRRALESLP